MKMKVHMQMMMAMALMAGTLISPRITNAALTPTTADARSAVVRNWLQYSRDQQWSNSLDEAPPVMQELFIEGQLVGYVAALSQGYILLPAYTELPPITAYSGDSHFDVNDEGGFVQFIKEELAQKIAVARDVSEAAQVSPAMQAAFEQVRKDRQLWQSYAGSYAEFSRAAAAETAASALDEVASVEPLLQSSWHQGAPYNAFCPLGSGGRSVVGCVATATAQIINFWRYPANGTGTHSYTWNGDNSCGTNVGGGVLTAEFSDALDWANTLNRYTGTETQAQKDAAAELCYEMGVAENMDFGRCGSGASLAAAVNAFRDHYGMASDIDIEPRADYANAAAWFGILQQELNAGHPMFYVIALHAIVCDGWRTSAGNQLHFNYGWSDSHTAWYTVDNLYCSWTGCNPMVEQTVRYIRPAGGSTPTPSLTLSAPNGGETWTVGAGATITWSSSNLSDNINVQLNRTYPTGTWETIGAAVANSGSFSWTISGAAATSARVRVVGVTSPTVGDTSNANFTIAAAPPPPVSSVTLAAPNGGETWTAGSTAIVSWSSLNVIGNVKVELNRAYPGGAWEAVIASTANDGAHTFTLSGAASSTARVRVVDVLTATVGDTSNANFTIVSTPPPTARSIAVTAPNGGETWAAGATATIRWTSANLTGYVSIQLNRAYPTGMWETVMASTVNDGMHSLILSGAAAAAARVRVTSITYPSVGDTSDANFTITAAAPIARTVTVTAPNGGESWATGALGTVRWTSSNITGYVRIQLNRSYPTGVWETVISSTVNDGSHAFALSGAAATAARVRVTSVSYPSVGDTSNANFTITAVAGQSLPLVAPNGGELLYLNSSTVIRWTPNGVVGYVKLQLNRTYPTGTWETITSTTINDGSHSWRVSGALSSRARVRVISVSNPATGDTSNADFRITGALIADTPASLTTELTGAYPNPFNPTTSLRYRISEAVEVHLDVFDVTGRMVASLANGMQPAGEYTARFDGANLGTGFYFVRFRAGDVNSVQKLQLLK